MHTQVSGRVTTVLWISVLFVSFFFTFFAIVKHAHADHPTAVELPDLTAGSISPTTTTVGTPTTLQATITNIAPDPSGSFPVLFQVQETGALINSSYISVSGEDSSASSASYTFASVGTYNVRACANFNTSWVNIDHESDYSNNCGDWTAVTVTSGQSDLAPGSGASSFTGTVGIPVELSDEVRNIGTVSTGIGFTDTFQKAADALGTGAITIGTYASPSIEKETANDATLSYTFPSAGTFYIRVCADMQPPANTGVITESNEANNCGDWHPATIVAGGQADLTAGSVTPTLANVGAPTILYTTAYNSGIGDSNDFPVLFQVQETGALETSAYIDGILAGGSGLASESLTFPSVGTYNVRACANFNTSWVNIVTESNYGNNCGPWTTVTVSVVEPSVSCTVSNQNPPTPGSQVTYTVTVLNGGDNPFTWDDSLGGVYGDGWTLIRTIPNWGKWPMSVKGRNTAFVICPLVTVGDDSCSNPPPPTGTITATFPRLRAGNSTTISWSLQRPVGAVCSVTGPGVTVSIPDISTCTGPIPLYSSNMVTPAITTQSVYRLICDGVTLSSAIVNVLPNIKEF